MIACGLDLGENTGFAVGPRGSEPQYGTWRLPGFSDRDMPRTMGSIMASVKTVVLQYRVIRVGIESPLRGIRRKLKSGQRVPVSAHGERVLTMLAGAAVAGAIAGGAQDVRMVAPSTWRAEVLGNGFPEDPKAEAFRYCRLIGLDPKDHNAAEGICIWHWTATQLR